MTTVGIDLEQFIRDPYGTGIQRVLQQLAINWPAGETKAEFVVPNRRGSFTLIDQATAAELLSLPFQERLPDDDLRQTVNEFLEQHDSSSIKCPPAPLRIDQETNKRHQQLRHQRKQQQRPA